MLEAEFSEDVVRKGLEEAAQTLRRFQSDAKNIAAVAQAGALLAKCLKAGGRVYSCGNGGSMCDAMHFAEELSGKFRKERPPLAAMAMSDPAHISCVGNDFGFDKIFSTFVSGHGKKGDVLFAISTSGKSPNVLNAADAARSAGMSVIALTGKPQSALASKADIEICAVGNAYSDRTQEMHIKVIHLLIELVERALFPANYE